MSAAGRITEASDVSVRRPGRATGTGRGVLLKMDTSASENQLALSDAPAARGATDVSENSLTLNTADAASAESAPQGQLPLARGQQFVDAEVAAVLRDGVLLNCIHNGREVKIQLPTSLVPENLRKFGEPVRITLHREQGVRMPSVEAREVAARRDDFDADFRAWLNSR